MRAKRVLPLLFSIAATTGLIYLFKPACPPEVAAAVTTTDSHRAPARAAEVEPIAQPDDVGRMFTVRRNLFAFVQVRTADTRVVPSPQAVSHTTVTPSRAAEVAHTTEPEFLYRYIGRFGPDANPIAVFAANGEIIDARVGDFLTGEFRLTAIGLESVDIASASGVIRRVSLHP